MLVRGAGGNNHLDEMARFPCLSSLPAAHGNGPRAYRVRGVCRTCPPVCPVENRGVTYREGGASHGGRHPRRNRDTGPHDTASPVFAQQRAYRVDHSVCFRRTSGARRKRSESANGAHRTRFPRSRLWFCVCLCFFFSSSGRGDARGETETSAGSGGADLSGVPEKDGEAGSDHGDPDSGKATC